MTSTEAELAFSGDVGIAIICGQVSGGVGFIDVEGRAPKQQLREAFEIQAPGLFDRFTRIATPNLGWHLGYKCSEIHGNQKLAMALDDGKPVVLIETRGEGGYVITISSPTSCHPSGRSYILEHGLLTDIQEFTPAEIEIAFSICRSFNSHVKPSQFVGMRPSTASVPAGSRPGDDYNNRGDALGLLKKHGWRAARQSGDAVYLQRPDKNQNGISATFGYVGRNVLYVFSSNAAPFDHERAYTGFGIYALLEHRGDYKAAARTLANQGYGSRRHRRTAEVVQSPEAKPEVEVAPMTPSVPKVDLLSYGSNDDGNAKRLIALSGNDMRYCYELKKWLIWDGRRWAVDATGRAFALAKLAMIRFLEQAEHRDPSEKFAIQSLDARRIEALLKMAQSEIPITTKELDTHPYLLNFLNGTIDLRTGVLRLQCREDYLTKLVHFDYRTDAKCPRFTTFVLRILGGTGSRTDRKRSLRMLCYLRRCIGYSVTGVTIEKAVFILFGSGDNGKTTLLEILRLLFVEYSTLIQIESIMATARQQTDNNVQSDIADLRGARFAITSESEKGQRLSESRLKRITQGRGMIKTARKYENPVSFPETHKLWIDANHRPVVKSNDNAIWNRLHLIPFEISIPKSEQVKDLADKIIAEEGEGIWAFIVRGAIRWSRTGIHRPIEIVRACATWRRDSSAQIGFAIEECSFEEGDRCTVKSMREAYEAWCEENSETPMSSREFNSYLVERGAVQPNQPQRIDGEKARVWLNVALKRQMEQVQDGTEFS